MAATPTSPPRSAPPKQPSPTPGAASRTPDTASTCARTPPELLGPLTQRLQTALAALRQVPHDLGEVYELVYQFIHCGGQMPRFDRWIEGAPA